MESTGIHGDPFERYWMICTYLRSMARQPALIASARLLRFFNNKTGVVIGGRLRWRFRTLVRTARKIVNVDNCPSNGTELGNVDYVTDAADLFFAPNETLDFVCSSHVLEHIANPFKAIGEWKRVVRDGGVIYAGVPDKRHTFDHARERTPLSHLIDDFNRDVDQTDETHAAEFLKGCDYEMADGPRRDELLKKVRNNPISTIHHHVWVVDDVAEIFEHMGLQVIYGPVLHHGTIHIIGRKSKR